MIILVAIWAIAVNWLAFKKGFYTFPKKGAKTSPLITHGQLFASFGIYLILSLFVAPLLAQFLFKLVHAFSPSTTSLPIIWITGFQFFSMVLIFCLLTSFIYQQDHLLFWKIWKDKQQIPCRPIEFDFGIGVLTWFLSFPIVTVIGEVADFILQSFFGLQTYEQAAVRFVKGATDSPLSLVFALLSILVLAPLVEEFLFRGILQNYFKRLLGVKAAILLSALFFALFHFSFSQGLGNVSLMVSLAILGLFLGFIYEKQGSLWTSIALHITFNSISALRIILLPESSL